MIVAERQEQAKTDHTAARVATVRAATTKMWLVSGGQVCFY